MTDLEAIADEVSTLLDAGLAGPYALFGHSMGALIAFEVAQRLARRGREPVALFVSGRAAPHLTSGYEGVKELSDDAFIDRMDTMYGGVPDLMRTDAEFRELYLPPLRADVSAVADYRPGATRPCRFAIHVYGGADDRSVTRTALEEWQRYAAGDFGVHIFPGNHFFVYSAQGPVVKSVTAALSKARATSSEGESGR